MPPSPITVLAVDDNIVVRAGLVTLLETSDDLKVVGEAGDGAQALDEARRLRPDVVLLDVRMPVQDGISTVEELSGLTKVIMLTHTEDAEIIRTALRRGASGYLVHGHFTVDELSRSLHEVVHGNGTPLSPVAATVVLQAMRSTPKRQEHTADLTELGLSEREGEVLSAAARGLPNSAIAAELYLTEKTVKNHINRIFRKLGVSTRSAAIARWNGDDAAAPTHSPPTAGPISGPRKPWAQPPE
ncbi:DNA-binding NarL/FixJ family response regulator [Spinactinospora alkalitolerans]|uniref:DNA-binding NarL/FixJ family response regulator n=1 Tax=Spinactinospora alkalitolerans TaxID=687207 RepID=A0A852TYV1_9ACTN|nr:response regulator transcription factor [Spinactinospora alkalitolerans]NYE49169.1 DNA-binding NarL/FixJ family response regulator [Spinactinospora alkalitolerans]